MKRHLSQLLFRACFGASLATVGGTATLACLDESTFPAFDQAEVLSFTIVEEARATVIDSEARRIDVTVADGADPTQIEIGSLEITSLASTKEAVGDQLDLTAPYDLIVTAEDGTKTTWTIYAELPVPPGMGGGPGNPDDCESWVVTYELQGTFETSDTPAGGAGDAVNDIGVGELVLRFPGAASGSSRVTLLSYFMPQIFTINSPGTDVTTDTQASAGPDSCGVASGTLVEGGITWDDCDYGSAPPHGTTGWGPEHVTGGPGCVRDYHSSGTVSCVGTFCSLAGLEQPKTIDDTYPQPLNQFEFSSATRFSMKGKGNPAEAGNQQSVEVPTLEPSRTWLAFDGVEVSRRCETLPSCQ